MEFYDFLWDLPTSARVLVHCAAGIGRTGIVAVSYLLLKGLDLEDAIASVDDWTHGYFLEEIKGRKDEVGRLMSRFRRLFRI